jgi:CelD/BcsL family acetyltransferase involved in cellulose biosynthesis
MIVNRLSGRRRAHDAISVRPSVPWQTIARRPAKSLPFPLSEPGCRLFARTRDCLWQGLGALGFERGEVVLVPAYHEAYQVEAALRAGITCRFYEATESLEPDDTELESLLGPRVRALFLSHHLGFPQDAPRWRHFCDRHGLALIEDCSQAWLASFDGRPAGSFGDLSVFSLYKTYGLSDGAAQLIRSRNSTANSVGDGFAVGSPQRAPSRLTLFLLPRVVDDGTAARRRANYSMLLDELVDLVPPPFKRLPEGGAPLLFPVGASAKANLLHRLADDGIHAEDLRPAPHPALPSAEFPGATALRDRLVGVPVHQELRLDQIERIVNAVRRRRSKPLSPRVELVPDLDSMRVEWNELAAKSRNVFATWEWNSIWWRHFGQRRALLTTACYAADGSLDAVLPLYLWSVRPLRIVRFLGHGAGNELGPVCGDTARVAAASALRSTLASVDCDVFFAEELPATDGWPALLGAKVHRRIGDPLIRLDAATWDDFLASRSPNFRQQIRRRERKLEREHGLRYRLTHDASSLQEDLDTLFRLHRARWRDRPSSFAASEAFHREFAAHAFEQGWLRLWSLELRGEAVAAWYGFRFCGVEFYYQAGRDPTWTDSTVGFVLLAHSVRAALEDGMDTYRLGRGATPYKARFASEDPGLEAVVLSRSVRGAAAVAGGHVARSFRPLKNALKAPLNI